MSRPRVIVVAKKSALSKLESGEGDARARKLIQKGHISVKKWQPAHEQHVRVVEDVYETLEKLGVETLLLHGAQVEFDPVGASLIVSVGGDGTLLAASHNVNDVPLLGINSAPKYSVGFFCAARGRSASQVLKRALFGEIPALELARMTVRQNGQIRSERVLNEALYCHAIPAATSNYIVQAGRRREEQRSSGLWVGTAAGSTAAIRSAGGRILPLTSTRLQMVVREPYLGRGRKPSLLREVLAPGGKVTVTSKMELGGVYLDGPYRQLTVRLGDEVTFETSEQPLSVVGLSRRREA
jgi:NAD+ kinase